MTTAAARTKVSSSECGFRATPPHARLAMEQAHDFFTASFEHAQGASAPAQGINDRAAGSLRNVDGARVGIARQMPLHRLAAALLHRKRHAQRPQLVVGGRGVMRQPPDQTPVVQAVAAAHHVVDVGVGIVLPIGVSQRRVEADHIG